MRLRASEKDGLSPVFLALREALGRSLRRLGSRDWGPCSSHPGSSGAPGASAEPRHRPP